MTLVEPSKAPRLGKGGSPESRIAILHSLAHIESWAIDLSWDAVARFGQLRKMPKEFFDDFVKVAQDEARHFRCLARRLEDLGSFYGALVAHDGLWNSAAETSRSLEARLVIEHCVHEARGLDVLPATIQKFRNGDDAPSGDLLEKIVYPEEVTHCAAGVRWFTYLCVRNDASCGDWDAHDPSHAFPEAHRGFSVPELREKKPEERFGDRGGNGSRDVTSSARDVFLAKKIKNPEPVLPKDCSVIEKFHRIVWRYFRGVLKPPFNHEARASAGFGKEWYEPLCRRPEWETRDEENETEASFARRRAGKAEVAA